MHEAMFDIFFLSQQTSLLMNDSDFLLLTHMNRDHFLRKSEDTDWNMEVLNFLFILCVIYLYSSHKTKYVIYLQVIAEMRYDLPKTHVFHKQKTKDIQVDLYRFTHRY